MHRILIADKNPVDLETVEIALKCVPEVTVEGAVGDPRRALALLRELRLDIAMVDAEMALGTDLDFLRELEGMQERPELILMGRQDHSAVRAFEMDAADYLPKPVCFDRVRASLRRAEKRIHSRGADARLAEVHDLLSAAASRRLGELSPKYESDIWVRDRDGLARVSASDVDLFEASGDYVIAHVRDATHVINESISSLESKLDPDDLLRVHRSRIVNLKRIRNIRRRRGGRGLAIVLANGAQVPVGPSYADTVLGVMKVRRWR